MIVLILSAIVTFFSTNVDDLMVLTLLFAQINNDMKKHHIVIGQYLGLGALIVISLAGAFGFSVISAEALAYLGLIPICLGIKVFWNNRKGAHHAEIGTHNVEKSSHHIEKVTHDIEVSEKNKLKYRLQHFINPSIALVFGITVANGGDNLGIYIPIFANLNVLDLLITLVIFQLLIGLWCYAAFKLASLPLVQKRIEAYKSVLVPLVFIGLGLYILTKNGLPI